MERGREELMDKKKKYKTHAGLPNAFCINPAIPYMSTQK